MIVPMMTNSPMRRASWCARSSCCQRSLSNQPNQPMTAYEPRPPWPRLLISIISCYFLSIFFLGTAGWLNCALSCIAGVLAYDLRSYKRECVCVCDLEGLTVEWIRTRQRSPKEKKRLFHGQLNIDASFHWQSSYFVPASIPGVNLRDGPSTLNGKTPFYGSVAGFCSPAGLDPGKFWFLWVSS